ncbi:MAG: glycosyltransferase family 2 protein [Bacteroidales bacterium]|nr:glycosyltransferase family 2 protein [Bacteroidales bacterium]MDD4670760.1 glycosyltransferase family 2 protein [Bacteroidales bacterium]
MISIISITYNGLEDTLEMIQSLKANLRSGSYEIIIIDNGSRINEAEAVSLKYKDVITVRSEKNLGFAGGNNLGMPIAKGKYILLLNNDTEVKDDSVRFLSDFLDANPEYGAVSPKILYYSHPDTIQYGGYTSLSEITVRNKTIGMGEKDKGQCDSTAETAYAHGAAMMVRREIIDKIGMIPEMFFLYYEEYDWCESIKRAGMKIGYEPKCSVYHKESAAIGIDSPLKSFYMTRNRLLFSWRNRRGIVRLLSVCYQLMIVVPKEFMLHLAKGQRQQSVSILKGLFSFFGINNKMG